MKNAFAIILAGLMLLTALPGFAFEATKADISGVEIGYDDGMVGPTRDDIGPDWITYDDGNGASLYGGASYWVKMHFTPNSLFRLMAVRLLPLNVAMNHEDPIRIMVYRLDQETSDFEELILDYTLDEVPDYDEWIVYELEEDELAEFESDETFAIMYNAPVGTWDPDNMQEGDGWWCLFDGTDNFHRSFMYRADFGDDPSDSDDDWLDVDGDLLIRANGEYLEDFIDIGVVSVVNDDDAWMAIPGTSQQYVANITNVNDDMGDAFVVAFSMLDPDGEVAWENDVRVEGIDGGDTVAVEASEVWQIADDAAVGAYTLWVSLEVADDVNDENDTYGLEQIISNFNANNDQWLSYVDGTAESTTSLNEGSGWTGAFWHPNTEDQALQLDAFRFLIITISGQNFPYDVDVSVMKMAPEGYTPLWEGTAEVTGEGEELDNGYIAEWVVVEAADIDWEDPNDGIIFPSEAFMITYMYDDRSVFPSDGTPPFAGTNVDMPPAFFTVQGDDVYLANRSDFFIEAQLSWSNLMLPGVHMEIVPETLEFGDDIEPDVDHVINAMVYSVGQETLEISLIDMAPRFANKISFNPNSDIEIASGDSLEIVVTFNTTELDTVSSQALVFNNSEEQNYVWPFTARTRAMGVNENARPGVPTEYSLSQNHPNPFNPVTTVEFALVKSGVVSFDIFDMSGRLVQNVFNGSLPAGFHSVEIDASALSTSMYMYKIQTADFSSSRKMTLMK